MRTPSHGRGRLRVGGTNKGGGRTPDKIRETLRLAFDQRIKVLQSFADDKNLDPQVRMKAIDQLAKYGLGTTFTQTGDDGKAVPTGIIVEYVNPEPPLPDRLAKSLNGNGHRN